MLIMKHLGNLLLYHHNVKQISFEDTDKKTDKPQS